MRNDDIDISDLIGKPYAENGRGPASYNCIGLGLEIDNRRGIYIPEYEIPKTRDERYALFEFIKESMFRKLDKPQPWCWAAFRIITPDGQVEWHTGKVLPDYRRFIHVRKKAAVCISRLSDICWREWLEGFYERA